MQHFLRQADVQPQKSLCIPTHLDQNGPEMIHFRSQNAKFYRQGVIQPPKLINTINLDYKGPEIKYILLTQCKFFLGKLACKLNSKTIIGLLINLD